MVFSDGLEGLDKLLQKIFKHHQLNYEESLCHGVIPKGLRIRKKPAFEPISDYIQIKWDEILYNVENNLVELLL